MSETFTNHPIFAHSAGHARDIGRGGLRAILLSGVVLMAFAVNDPAYRGKEANAAGLQREAAAPVLASESGNDGSEQDRGDRLASLAESARDKLDQVVRRPVVRGTIGPEQALVTPTGADVGQELTCLALNVYHEARGEPERGKYAVAHVVMNRVADRRFPSTVCRVVKQGGELTRYRCQFSWWCDGQSDRPREAKAWAASQVIAADVFWGRDRDPTRGALWYHADYVSPYWRTAFKQGPKIGRHFFYQRKGKVQVASAS